MSIKKALFGGGVETRATASYQGSIQDWLPVKNIIGGVVITKDNRFIKILEIVPVNIYLKSAEDRQAIVEAFAAYLKIAPDHMQFEARTLPADISRYVERMQEYAKNEDNAYCREMIQDNIQDIGMGVACNALQHRFFMVFQYESQMRASPTPCRALSSGSMRRRTPPAAIWICASWRCRSRAMRTILRWSCSMRSSTSAPASVSSCRRACLI